MNLQLDIGNTRVKWRACDRHGSIVAQGHIPRSSGGGTLRAIELSDAPSSVWVSSVAGSDFEAELAHEVHSLWGLSPWFARSTQFEQGLSNSYADPVRLGVDRWLAMLAAWTLHRGALCVIDAGSALTIDFVAADGSHTGGYIIPGVDSMQRALFSDTDRVIPGDGARDQLTPGRSTAAAVFNGVNLAQAGAVEMALRQQPQAQRLFFCGGNAQLLMQQLSMEGELHADLVLDGLATLATAHAGDTAERGGVVQ